MAATVSIRKLTGANAAITSTDITSGSMRVGTSDEATNASTIPVPTSGSNYSYWATTQLNCTVAPTNSLTNVKWWSDAGSFGTGITAFVGVASGYASAVGTAGSSGSVLNTSNHAGLTGAPSLMTTYTSSCKLTLAGSLGATTGSFGYRAVMQLDVDTTAGAGNSSERTITLSWDES